jgi:hypothetical protein
MTPQLSRRLRMAADPATWTTLASDARWSRAGACPAPEVSLHLGAPATVRWPTHYEHPIAESFVGPIREGLAALAAIEPADIEQPHKGIVVIEIDLGDGPRRVAIDYYDFTFINEQCAAEVDTYFKFQHERDGYPGFENIRPGGYVATSPFLSAHWCRLRALRRRESATSDVFGRFGLRWSAPIRESAIEILRSDERLDFSGGSKPVQQSRYMREMARARVCVDMPGQGPFCCRLVENMAIGSCVVARRHSTVLPADLRDGIEVVYCREDLSDLGDLCAEYAHDESLRRSVEEGASRYYDEHLHPVRIAEHYLRTLGNAGPA